MERMARPWDHSIQPLIDARPPPTVTLPTPPVIPVRQFVLTRRYARPTSPADRAKPTAEAPRMTEATLHAESVSTSPDRHTPSAGGNGRNRRAQPSIGYSPADLECPRVAWDHARV